MIASKHLSDYTFHLDAWNRCTDHQFWTDAWNRSADDASKHTSLQMALHSGSRSLVIRPIHSSEELRQGNNT